jgi:threonine dehydratase
MSSPTSPYESEAIPVTIDDIRAAHARISPRIHRTPVFTSSSLDEIAGARLFFKCENLQKTGSFKIRGATNAIFSLTGEQSKNGIATPSSGNHAAAVAQAARWRGVPAYIVMPSNSSPAKMRAVESYGGEITLCEPNIPSRESVTAEILKKTGAHMVHPYNDARVIAGQGTAALELLEEIPDLDAIIAPVSGGGLLSGTAIAAKALRPGIRVIGAEPVNADDAFRSLASGAIEPVATTQTIADGLRAQLCPLTFSIIRKLVDEISLVSEEEIVASMLQLWERMKLVVEPSGAVPAAAALTRKPSLLHRKMGGETPVLPRIGLILSGGNLDLKNLPF